jgi:hypothetical protein
MRAMPALLQGPFQQHRKGPPSRCASTAKAVLGRARRFGPPGWISPSPSRAAVSTCRDAAKPIRSRCLRTVDPLANLLLRRTGQPARGGERRGHRQQRGRSPLVRPSQQQQLAQLGRVPARDHGGPRIALRVCTTAAFNSATAVAPGTSRVSRLASSYLLDASDSQR